MYAFSTSLRACARRPLLSVGALLLASGAAGAAGGSRPAAPAGVLRTQAISYTEVGAATLPTIQFTRRVFYDADGDGDQDLLYQDGNTNNAGINLRLNNGSGDFSTVIAANSAGTFTSGPLNGITFVTVATYNTTAATGPNQRAVDIDNDGDQDLVEYASGAAPRVMYNNRGTSTASTSTSLPVLTYIATSPTRGVFYDADGDGDQDFLYQTSTNATGTDIYLKLNDGTGNFATTYAATSNGSTGTFGSGPLSGIGFANVVPNGFSPGLDVVDIDDDGDQDLVLYTNSTTPRVTRNDRGTSVNLASTSLPTLAFATRHVFFDADSDGDDDILYQSTANTTGTDIYLALNDGTGNFNNTYAASSAGTFTNGPLNGITFTQILPFSASGGITVVDYDNDRDDDLAIFTNGAATRVVRQDNTRPVITAYSPLNGATGVSPSTNIVLTFDRSVGKGNGNLYLVNVATNTIVETVAVGTGTITGAGTTWTYNPSVTLAGNTRYALRTDEEIFLDGDGRAFAGIFDNTTYSFTTGATPTTVSSIGPAGANPTNATSVSFTVTFATSVTGLASSNFATAPGGGLSGSSITALTGSGATYTVVVNTGSGSGTLGLNLANATGISPGIANVPFVGQTYTIDKTAPTVVLTSSTAASGSATSSTPFAFTATFSESVTGFTAGGVTTNGAVSGFAGSGPTYTFNVAPATGGATTVSIAAGVAQDAATNGNAASNTYSLTYAVLPTVATAAPSNVAGTSARLGGSVTADGGATVTSRGVVYSLTSTNAAPTIGGTGVTQDANGSGIGTYSKLINGLTASTTYTVRAYASNSIGPGYGSAVTFTTAAALSATPSQTNVSCNGGSTGAASVAVTGGLPPYTYAWSPSVSTTNSATGLSAGTYTVTVTDASGAATSRSFTISEPAALAATTAQTTVTTNGGNNGSATITVSGGTPAYSYSWSPNVSATATASNLSAGTYTVTATDANGCTIARTFTITQPAAVTAAPVVTAPANGSLLATSTPTYSGTAPAGSTVTVYVDNASVGTTTATGGSFSLTPAAALADGQHTVYATAQLSGQTVSANSSTTTFTVDATAPTATLSTTAGSTTSTSPIPFSVSFSETVTGFSASGISVTNGTVTGGTVSGSGPYTFTVTPTANGSVTVSVRANAAQDAAGNGNLASATVSVTYTAPITATTWTGTISPDWFTAGNWTAGVPTATIDATVSGGTVFSPVISTGTATTRSLTLNSGATLNMSGGTLEVRANLTSNGTFVPAGGTVVLGTTASSNGPNILGSSRVRFWNLTVNANGVLLSTSAGASVRRLLTLNGAFITQANPFVLESDAAGTALVVNSSSAGFVSGSATVQRYLDASGNTGTSGYRHYSSPVGGATVSSLSTSAYGGSFTAQVNAAYNTADPNQLTLATYPNVFSYDESKIAASPAVSFSDFDKGYQSPTSLNSPLTVGRGYAVQIGNAEKVQFTGPLNNNTQTITGLTYAAAGTSGAASAGWALIGNPYPAPLDWRTVGTATGSSLNGVDGAAYVFQSTSAYSGRYTSFINNVGASTGLIASGQGFFVRASTPGTTGSITLTNANRLTSYANPAFQRTQAETRPLLRLSLGLGTQPATIATAQDETFVYFEAGASNAYDGKYDAYKLANPSGYYLGSATPGSAPRGLSIDGRAPLAAATTTEIPLWVSLPAGTYSLTATELLNFAALAGGTTVQLRDALLGTLTDLATTPSYGFAVAANAPYAGRFSLVFRPSGVLATLPGTELAQAKTSLYPNPATSATALSITGLPVAVAGLQVEVVDVLGRAVAHYSLPVRAGSAYQSLPTDQLAGTLYLLRLTALDAQGQVQGTLPTQRLTLNR